MRIVVIGGGHAGCEAAAALRRMGLSVSLVTHNFETIGSMSCNPAIGGLAKGHVVREIDALGGIMGKIADSATIQRKYLNESKGPAVRATRVQCDKRVYSRKMQEEIVREGIDVLQDEFLYPVIENGSVSGVYLRLRGHLPCQAVIVTTGTFLRGLMHFGNEKISGGRFGDVGANGFTEWLHANGFRTQRLKTGTPPRILRSSVDFSKMEEQYGDQRSRAFHWENGFSFQLPQVCCYITHTNEQTHEVIRKNRDRSPIFNGQIEGVGPRYCPSIEDKVYRFADKTRHQIFVEPEGIDSVDLYPNGISTSLPVDVQEAFVRTIPGLENSIFTRPGYAVEYDAIDSSQLRVTFESKDIRGLYFAGQINGTSGYEEAAGQGLVAGVNAGAYLKGLEAWNPSRYESYIGVMAEDLTRWGPEEPYRLFSSRAEARLVLREDNSIDRLEKTARKYGLWPRGQEAFWSDILETEQKVENSLKNQRDSASHKTLFDRLKEPEIKMSFFNFNDLDPWICERLETRIKYSGYLKREDEIWAKIRKSGETQISKDIDFSNILGLSTEVKNMLSAHRPSTIGELKKLKGITPAAIASIFIYVKRSQSRESHPEISSTVSTV